MSYVNADRMRPRRPLYTEIPEGKELVMDTSTIPVGPVGNDIGDVTEAVWGVTGSAGATGLMGLTGTTGPVGGYINRRTMNIVKQHEDPCEDFDMGNISNVDDEWCGVRQEMNRSTDQLRREINEMKFRHDMVERHQNALRGAAGAGWELLGGMITTPEGVRSSIQSPDGKHTVTLKTCPTSEEIAKSSAPKGPESTPRSSSMIGKVKEYLDAKLQVTPKSVGPGNVQLQNGGLPRFQKKLERGARKG